MTVSPWEWWAEACEGQHRESDQRNGHATAIVLTGLAFGLFHGQLQQLPALIAFGCAMGYLRSATSSIYPGIATHALLNLTSVALAVTVTA